ncbi:MAG: hypothetical protein LBO72_00685 [Helicobacteraceae bacterium]|jgi:TPR repeat protein|nr:hypothetical protein [Helicobacteraceae bacterium]
MIRTIIALLLLSTLAFSIERLKKECENKNGESCCKLADLYSSGANGPKKDIQKAKELYEQACDYKYGEACDMLAASYESIDVNLSLVHYDKGCEYGYGSSCDKIGDMYANGVGRYSGKAAEINIAKAMEYYVKACGVDVFYCNYAGEIHENGYKGVPKNPTKAVEYYKKYCDSKFEDLETCQKVGQAYASGDGVPKDYKIALKYYDKACEHDDRGSVCSRRDEIKAFIDYGGDDNLSKAYLKSCEMNTAASCYMATYLYMNGSDGFPRDHGKAIEYFQKACKLGHQFACRMGKYYMKEWKIQETNLSINRP